jgi:hypothetical protein
VNLKAATATIESASTDIQSELIRLTGTLALSPAVKGDILVAQMTNLLTTLVQLCVVVKAKDGMDPALIAVQAQIQGMIPSLIDILSEKVLLS